MVLTEERRRRPRLLILLTGIAQGAVQGVDGDVRVLLLRWKKRLDGEDQGTGGADEENLHVLSHVDGTWQCRTGGQSIPRTS